MARRLLVLAAAIVLAACGSTPGQQPARSSPTSASSPSARPSANEPVVAVEQSDNKGGYTIKLVSLDGVRVASIHIAGDIQIVGAGGSSVVFVERTLHKDQRGQLVSIDETLKALHRDGSVEVLQTFTGLGFISWGTRLTPQDSRQVTDFVLSPDGSRWLWSEIGYSGGVTAGYPNHSALHLGGSGGSDRVIVSLDSGQNWITAYQWDDGGPIVVQRSILTGDIAGAPGPHGDAYLLTLESGTLSPFWSYAEGSPGTCDLQARAEDGTIACLSGAHYAGYSLKFGKPPNLPISIPVETAAVTGASFTVNGLFTVSFKPGSMALIAAVGHCTLSESSEPMACSTDLVDVTTGKLQSFGPAGLTPPGSSWAWLDDGSLVENTAASSTADYRAYVVSQKGEARFLASGTAFGVLRG